MSHSTYNRWWIMSKKQLEDLQVQEAIRESQKIEMITDRWEANYVVGGLYARYNMAVQGLTASFDQSVLVQKLFTMKKLVDAAVTRLCEIREYLTDICISEYHYIDGNLIELFLVPHSIQIIDPSFALDRPLEIEDLWTRIKNGETIYVPPTPESSIGSETGEVKESEPPKASETGLEVSPSSADQERKRSLSIQKPQTEEDRERERVKKIKEATIMIQNHERGRQSRLYFSELWYRNQLKQRAAFGIPIPPSAPIQVQEAACIKIQKVWRGYTARQYMKRREKRRRILIGMTEPSWKSTAVQDKTDNIQEERRALRAQRIREYIDTNLAEKDRVLRVIGPGLMEDVGEEIRTWFRAWYDQIRAFPEYPTDEQGGSILIVRGEVMTPNEFLEDAAKKKKEKEMGKGKDDKEKLKAAAEKAKKEEQAKKKKEAEKKRKEAEYLQKLRDKGEYEFKWLPPSKSPEIFQEGMEEYKRIWNKRPFEENPRQQLYMDIITEEKCCEMHQEIRPPVDELMRLELILLKAALAKDKRKKAPKVKPPKAPRPQRSRDPTGHRTTEDLFQELVDNGIIHTYPRARMRDFFGDFSYCNYEYRNQDLDPPPKVGDVRHAVVMNCILPMALETMEKPKSVLIAGPPQCGKHILANAIFNETRCVLFDLSAPILAGKYPGPMGLKMLVHLVTKMSRILQPSIIFIDGGEKPFYKKVPKEEKKQEPKKIGKVLVKGLIKPILPEEKVLVLAISNQPHAAQKKINKAYDKIIFIPRTDYGTAYLYWRELLRPYHGVDRDFSISEVAKFSETYSLSAIRAACEKVLTPRRVTQLKNKPLDPHEILDALAAGEQPMDEKEWGKYEKWMVKTPMMKLRIKYITIKEELKAAANKKK